MSVCNEHGRFEEKFVNAEKWQKEHMKNIHEPLEERVDNMDTKLDSIYKVLIGTLAATITSLILLAINLGVRGAG